MVQLSRGRYAQLYGPTAGDRVRLADTDLLIEVEEDRCGGPGRAGEEAVFGGGKVIRESMGQGRASRAEGTPDLVITGAVVLDHWASSRPTSASATAGSWRWARRATPTRWTASTRTWSSGRAPRCSPATAGSSPPAASTATCTSSARRSRPRRWARASPR